MFEYRDVSAPYPGLRPFEAYEAGIFCGRDTHTDRLLEILQRERFLAVIGPSGSGKSSLVRAGMLPALAAGWLGTGSEWRLALLRPGDRPIRNLARAILDANALGRELCDETADAVSEATRMLPLVHAELHRGPLGLLHLVDSATRVHGSDEAFNLLVLVDQFEEIFRYMDRDGTVADEAAAFVELLLRTRADETAHVFIAMTMRTDFLGHCTRFLDLPEAINRAQYLTPRLDRAQLETAIAAPARIFGGDVEPEVVNELINVVAADFDQLPILQHALARMWEEAKKKDPTSPTVTRQELDESGGVERALDRHAEAIFAALPADQQTLAEHLFRTITGRSQPDSGSRDTRRPRTLLQIADAAGAGQRWEEFLPVVAAFSGEGVNFVTHGDPIDADTTIDISHEALIRQWHRLRAWVDAEAHHAADYRRWRDRVGQELLGGVDLARALEWQAGSSAWQPTAAWARRYAAAGDATAEFDATIAFIEQSKAADDKRRQDEEERRQRVQAIETARLRAEAAAAATRADAARARTRYLAIGAAIVVVAAVALFVAWMRARDALAETQRTLAGLRFRDAVNRVGLDKRAEALAYLAEAMRILPDYPAARVLTASLLLDRTWPLQKAAPIRLQGGARWVGMSSDGSHLVSASDDDTAQLWDAQSGAPVGEPMHHDGWVRFAAISPDGKRVVTASDDGFARLWDGETGKPLIGSQAMHHGAVINSATFSPDGTRIVTASTDKTARLWDAKSGVALPASHPMMHEAPVLYAAFSPNGTRVVTTTAKDDLMPSSAVLWDVKSGTRIPGTEPMARGGAVLWAAYSPDGARIVTASVDGTARLWSADTGEPLKGAEVMRHADAVNVSTFSPDGSFVATESDDGSARLWDATSGKPVAEPILHRGAVTALAFTAAGKRLATASKDQTVRVSEARPGSALAEPFQLSGAFLASFNHDGSKILTVDEKAVRVWDSRTRKLLNEIDAQPGHEMSFAAFSPNGAQIVVVSQKMVQIFDVDSRVARTTLTGVADDVRSADISADGTRVVVALGNSAQLWDAKSGTPLEGAKPMPHDKLVWSVVFSPDGRSVVTASWDGTAKLWDAHSGNPLAPHEVMKTDGSKVFSAVFNQKGTEIVTASSDGTAQVRDAQSGKPVGEAIKAGAELVSASFNSDGTQILTVSDSGAGRIWDATSGTALSEPVPYVGSLRSARFSTDDRYLLMAGAQGVQIYTRPRLTPADQPDLETLAEIVGGFRFDHDSGGLVRFDDNATDLSQLESKYERSGNGDFAALVRWFLTDRDARSISPFSTLTAPQYHATLAEPRSSD